MPGMAMPTIPKGALYTAADVHFMQGMIAHHGQAIHMSRLAAARGANPRVLKLAQKIDQSQEVEIRLGPLFGDGDVCSADMSGHVTVVELPRGVTPTKPLVARFAEHEMSIPAVGG